MKKTAKLEVRMRGFLMMFLGLFFAAVFLIDSLIGSEPYSLQAALLAPLLPSVFVHVGYSLFRKGVFQSQGWDGFSSKDIVQTLGRVLNKWFLAKHFLRQFKLVFSILVLIAVAICFLINGQFSWELSSAFFIQLFVYVAYVFVLSRFSKSIGGFLNKLFENRLHSAEVNAKGITFILTDSIASNPERKLSIQVDYSEIVELKLFSEQEAKSYMAIQFAATKDQYASAATEWIAFMKDNVRPSVLVRILFGGRTVMIRGEKIFYMITVNAEDVKDLESLFEQSQKREVKLPQSPGWKY